MVNGYWYKYVYVYIKYVKEIFVFWKYNEIMMVISRYFVMCNLEICFFIEYYDCVIYVFYFIKLVFGILGFIVMILKYMYFEKNYCF